MMSKSSEMSSMADTNMSADPTAVYIHDPDGTVANGTSTEAGQSQPDNDKDRDSDKGKDNDSDKGKGKDNKEKPPMVGVGETFRFATGKDKALMALGLLMAWCNGAALPVMIIIFGEMTDTFINDSWFDKEIEKRLPTFIQDCQNLVPSYNCANLTADFLRDNFMAVLGDTSHPLFPVFVSSNLTTEMESRLILSLLGDMQTYALYFTAIGCAVFVAGYLQVLCWQTAAHNQSRRIRTKLLQAIMRQEIGWFDTHESGELNTRLADDVIKVESGIGDKLGLFFQWFSAFVVGFIIGFVYGWKLTLVILAISPLLVLCGIVMGKVGAAMTSRELKAYAKAGAVAEEVFSSIRTVIAFGGQARECKRYEANLLEARAVGIKKGMMNGLSMGFLYLIMFGSYGLAFWYGSKLIIEEDFSAGRLMIVFFCVLIGAFSLGNSAPNIQYFATSRGAAYAIYRIIDQVPDIDSSSPEGSKDDRITGNVEFKDVVFNYPSRPDVKVLQGLNLKINVGQTVALVGPSGCGKSTTVQLLQRFYDPLGGKIMIDGHDIREFNIKWLRQKIGVVSQEPVLFATTIEENIRYGQDGVTRQDIERAAIEANAHDFIMKLPKQYATLVGERGAQLSGGQKQRIAIARALVRDPKILLLDEATSALDTESEATVQVALDKVRQGRTTLIIAHRLSTVRTADMIYGVDNGVVVESGSHEELMQDSGLYHTLVTNQLVEDEQDEEEDATPLPPKDILERAISVDSTRGSGRRKRGISISSDKAVERSTSVGAVGDEEENLPEPELKRILRMNAPEWGYILLGCVCAIIMGGVQPAFAIVFADILKVFSEDDDVIMESVKLYCGLFVAIGVIAALSMVGAGLSFAKSGEHLTMRMRQTTFKTIVRQDIAFFDDHRNNTGALTTRLSTDASAVQGATGARLSTFCQSLASIGAGVVIGFVYSWQLTLLLLAFAPFMLIAGFIQMKVISGDLGDKKKAFEEAGKIAIEAIENIRTVATLTKEEKFYQDYCKQIAIPYRQNFKKTQIQSVASGFSQAIVFFAYGAAFTLGAYLIEEGQLAYDDLFKVFMAIVFGAMAAGEAGSFAPDYGKAKASAAILFHLFDRVPSIDSASDEGSTIAHVTGQLELKNVYFNYPTRPNQPVLRGLDLTVSPGQTVALVGSSGCGKSTTVSLLERFYDPFQGELTLDGTDITKLKLPWLRGQLGIVSQEPVLFDCSIRENIAYGDNTREVPMQEVIAAAKNANIHTFVDSLPEGYDTNVGDKGAQLSGGQKQRVAIARALVRNPKVLLLDEATSALDTESEKVVQDALDRAQEGRTCIVIAHRLSTIQNADQIVVIHNGHMAEIGTHQELMNSRGRYYRLQNTQVVSG